jgi:carboxypeptidase C (cathepsin A)
MMHSRPTIGAAILVAFLALAPAWAQPQPKSEQPAAPAAAQAAQTPPESVTQHAVGEGAARLSYTATAGTLPATNAKGETTARIFYVAYTAAGENRPISFVFNGGPGAAAAFLHLSAIGPKVLNYDASGVKPVEPVALADNPDSWLPFTDMVFVDPVGTGFSRTADGGEESEKTFYGVEQDADAMRDFVRLYLARASRPLAPVYVVGESYGGFRAALLANRLLRGGIRVQGAVLISPALEFSMLRGDEFALVPLALDLPPVVASHLERAGGIGAPFDLVKEAEALARSTYLVSLAQGLAASEAMTAQLAKMTGLDPKVVARHHGRVSAELFRQEILRNTDRAVSVYDGAISAPMPRPSYSRGFDPILDIAVTVLSPLMVSYARDQLGYKTDLPYVLLNREVNGKWDFGFKGNRQGFVGSLEDLQDARTLNPDLKVFIAHGYTDLVTPYTVSEFLIGQLAPIEKARPIDFRVYRGGHMMYMRPSSRKALTEDARTIYAAK